jgi:hypothetical protein
MKKLLLMAVLISMTASLLSARTVEFAGLTWEVRAWGGAPGNGCWSDDEKSVWVDDEGALHLRIRKVGGIWCQAEVRALDFADYGDHTFFVKSRLDQLDPSAVLGMFLYGRHSELDIEMTGSFGSTAQRGWYTVFGEQERLVAHESFEVVLSGTFTTHQIRWLADRLVFQSWHGHCKAPPCGGIIHRWDYDGPSRPSRENRMQPMINFWINDSGKVKKEQEVVISSYETAAIVDRRRPVGRRGDRAKTPSPDSDP